MGQPLLEVTESQRVSWHLFMTWKKSDSTSCLKSYQAMSLCPFLSFLTKWHFVRKSKQWLNNVCWHISPHLVNLPVILPSPFSNSIPSPFYVNSRERSGTKGWSFPPPPRSIFICAIDSTTHPVPLLERFPVTSSSQGIFDKAFCHLWYLAIPFNNLLHSL